MMHLKFEYDHDGTEGYGRTVICFESEEYRGKGDFWSTPAEFLDFAEQLSTYPLRPDAPPEFRSYPDEDPLVLMRVEPVDAVGHLKLLVVLTDSLETANRLSVSVGISYADLQTLQRALRQLGNPPYPPQSVEFGS